MENADGLVLVDQHAAHERILFEELRRRMEEHGVPTQKLLLPHTFDVPPRDADWIERNISILQKMGIGIESFGPGTFKIDSLPGFLSVSDPAQFMRKVIDDLKLTSLFRRSQRHCSFAWQYPLRRSSGYGRTCAAVAGRLARPKRFPSVAQGRREERL